MAVIEQDQNRVDAEPTSAADKGQVGCCDLVDSSVLYQIGTTYGFTPLTISVGTAYFRRLAASNQAMLQVSSAHPSFNALVNGLTFTGPGKPLVGAIHARYLPSNEAWLALIYLTCTYIAAKNLEDIPRKCLLQTIISHIYGAEPCAIDPQLSWDLEIECLEALEWKLGLPHRHHERLSCKTDSKLPVPYLVSQEPGSNDTKEPAQPSEGTATSRTNLHPDRLKDPSTVALKEVVPVCKPEPFHTLCKTQKSLAQPAVSKFEGSVCAWRQHRAMQLAWMLTSTLLLLATVFFNTYFMAVAFLPSLLGQQTACLGLAFLGWGPDAQRSRRKWFFKVQQAGAIITAVCSASLALVMAFHVTQCSKGGAACGLLDVSGSRVSLESMLVVGYAVHAIVSVTASKYAHEAQSILDRDNDGMMV